MLASINFELYQCEISIDDGNKRRFALTIVGTSTVQMFQAESEDEAASWVETINLHIHGSKGYLLRKLAPNNIISFWR